MNETSSKAKGAKQDMRLHVTFCEVSQGYFVLGTPSYRGLHIWNSIPWAMEDSEDRVHVRMGLPGPGAGARHGTCCWSPLVRAGASDVHEATALGLRLRKAFRSKVPVDCYEMKQCFKHTWLFRRTAGLGVQFGKPPHLQVEIFLQSCRG